MRKNDFAAKGNILIKKEEEMNDETHGAQVPSYCSAQIFSFFRRRVVHKKVRNGAADAALGRSGYHHCV